MDLAFASSSSDMKRLFEQILVMVRDSAVTVQKAARETVLALSGLITNFEELLSRLTPGQQKLYQEEVAGKSVKTTQEMKLLRSSLRNFTESPAPHSALMEPLERPTGGYAFQSSSISSIAQTLAASKAPQVLSQSQIAPNGLEFGFIPSDLMAQLRDGTNWRTRATAIQELEGLISTTESFDPVMPYMAAFFRLLKELLEDTNFKVMQSTLSIIGALVGVTNITKRANIAQLIPACIDKLGDNKIAIRQAAFRVFKIFIREIPARVLFPHFQEGLESQNWHIREEVVQLLITAMLSALPNFEYDFLQVIPWVCKLLKDQKPKVKFAAVETFAVLAHLKGSEAVLEAASGLIDEDQIETLRSRFLQTHLPILQEEFVEFPKLMPTSAPTYIPVPMLMSTPPPEEPSDMRFSSATETPFKRGAEPKELNSTNSTEDASASSQADFAKLNGQKRLAASSLDFHSRRNPVRVTRRFFAFRQGSIGQRDLPPPSSLRPPTIPINMTTKAGGSSKKVSYGYQVRGSSLVRKNMTRYRTYQSFEEAQDTSSQLSVETGPKPLPEASKPDQSLYMSSEELPPVSNPEAEFQSCLETSKAQDWSSNFDTLNMIRRLLKHHPGVFLAQTSLHAIVLNIIRMADSLRSSLAKNSLIVLSEMSQALKRTLDMEMEVLSALLLRKCADTNVFISQEAAKALVVLCSNCTGSRVAASMLVQANFAKSVAMKAKIANGFQLVFDRNAGFLHKIKDLDKIITLLAGYLSDAGQEVRANSRAALLALKGAYGLEGEFDRMVERTLSEIMARKVKEIMDQEGVSSPTEAALISPKRPPLSSRRPVAKSYNEPQDPADFADLPRLVADISHAEWKRRYEAVDCALALVSKHTDVLKRSAKLVTVIDLLNKALGDSNLSVTLHALSGMAKAIPLLTGALEPHTPLLIHTLVLGVGSSNSAIRDAARHSLYTLLSNCDFGYSVPAFTSALHSSIPKAKPTLISLLCGTFHVDFLPSVHSTKPSLIHKQVIPLTFKLLDDPKQEVRSECHKLVHALYAVIGSVLVECTPASKLQKVMDLLNE